MDLSAGRACTLFASFRSGSMAGAIYPMDTERERFSVMAASTLGRAKRSKPARERARARGRSTVLTQRKQRVAPRSRANLKPWLPGQSGNPAGRPRGARSKLTEAFLADFLGVWERHGVAVLERVAKRDPVAFLNAAVQLMPKKATLEALVDFPSTAELIANYQEPAR
jgi:Family of unknown function (DUF5681)